MSKRAINPKHVLILGAGPGLSASIAHRFGHEGYTITLLARSEQNVTTLAQELRNDVDTATADAADLRASAPPSRSWPSASPPAWSYTTPPSSPATASSTSTMSRFSCRRGRLPAP
jgi:NAD(P)-dependent dehydrogenase (short-subunit alcohol dehydrogenase family)